MESVLKKNLDNLYSTFDIKYITPDPLEFVHRFKGSAEVRDMEIAGLISSSLAYGRVAQIKKSIEEVLSIMGGEPYEYTVNFDPRKGKRDFKSFKHRFNTGADLAALIYYGRQMIEESGTIGRFFEEGYSPSDRNIRPALESFVERVLALDSRAVYGRRSLPASAGVRYFFPNPKKGSSCKRLNLYLRWMVRRSTALDGVDMGLWRGVDPEKLIIPLDTHIARISRNIGLTSRTSADWKMAVEITESLKRFDPRDPIKYDFSLCRLGILERCPTSLDIGKCRECLIKEICVL